MFVWVTGNGQIHSQKWDTIQTTASSQIFGNGNKTNSVINWMKQKHSASYCVATSKQSSRNKAILSWSDSSSSWAVQCKWSDSYEGYLKNGHCLVSAPFLSSNDVSDLVQHDNECVAKLISAVKPKLSLLLMTFLFCDPFGIKWCICVPGKCELEDD